MLCFIYACEDRYQGLHGIENYGVMDCLDYEEAMEIGCTWSAELTDDYGLEDEYEDEEEMFDRELIAYSYKIKPEFAAMGRHALDEKCCELGSDLFIERYCENWTDEEMGIK